MRTKPLVLFDPYPRPRARIFNAAQWARLTAIATIVETGDGQMADEIVERWLPEASVDKILGDNAARFYRRFERAPVGAAPTTDRV